MIVFKKWYLLIFSLLHAVSLTFAGITTFNLVQSTRSHLHSSMSLTTGKLSVWLCLVTYSDGIIFFSAVVVCSLKVMQDPDVAQWYHCGIQLNFGYQSAVVVLLVPLWIFTRICEYSAACRVFTVYTWCFLYAWIRCAWLACAEMNY